jgi:hypothetical protein
MDRNIRHHHLTPSQGINTRIEPQRQQRNKTIASSVKSKPGKKPPTMAQLYKIIVACVYIFTFPQTECVIFAGPAATSHTMTGVAAAGAANAAVGAANAALAAPTRPRAFKPYGSPPPFDLEAEKDSFDTWVRRWEIFLALSTIDEVLDAGLRPAYKTNLLLSCFSIQTLQTVLSAGLSQAQLADHDQITGMLRTRCNAGKNRHIWRHQMALCTQRPKQQADKRLCELRDVSRKCDIIGDCCAICEATSILGQIVTGVADNEVRIKLLEQGDTLTLNGAIAILRTAETSQLQAVNLRDKSSIYAIRRSTYQNKKAAEGNPGAAKHPEEKKDGVRFEKDSSTSCRFCGEPSRHIRRDGPAWGKKCHN